MTHRQHKSDEAAIESVLDRIFDAGNPYGSATVARP
jgi:hypothetical protein